MLVLLGFFCFCEVSHGQREITGSNTNGLIPKPEADRIANLSAMNSSACWGDRGKTSCGCEGDCGKETGSPSVMGLAGGISTGRIGYSHTASYVDNSKLSFHHFTYDYTPGLASSSCVSCGASEQIAAIPSFLDLRIERRHRYRNLVESGSFGPGVFCNYDIRATFFPSGFDGGEDGVSGRQVVDRDGNQINEFFYSDTENGNFSVAAAQVDVFDPVEDHTIRVGDEPGGDIRYLDLRNKRVKEGWFLDGDGNAVAGAETAVTFELVAHEGQRFVFEILSRLGEYEGRLIAIRDRNGYETVLEYEFAATDQSQDMAALRRLSTVKDPHGRTATFHYHPTQVGGGWVVNKIDLPNGSSVEYQYDSAGQINDHYSAGRLTGVTLPDGTQSSFTYDFTAKITKIGFSDASAKATSREKLVYLTNSNHLRKNSEVLNQQTMLVRQIRNGEDEVSYLSETRNFATRWVYEGQGKAQLNRSLSMVYSRYYQDLDSDGLPTQNKERTYGRTGTGFGTTVSSLSLTATNIFSSGQFRWFRDEQDVRVDFEYDNESFPIVKEYSDGTKELYEYNDFKQLVRYEDRLGRVTRWTYDERGNETSRNVGILVGGPNDIDFHDLANPNGPPAAFTSTVEFGRYRKEYYPAGHQNQFLLRYDFDANGNRTEFIYNSDQFLIETKEPDDTGAGFHTESSYVYDTAGRLASSADAMGRTMAFKYDDRDRLIQTEFNDGSTERMAYGTNGTGGEIDTANVIVASQDRNGNVTSFEYDTQGRVTKRIDASHKVPLASVTNASVTNLNNLLSGTEVTNPTVRVESTYSYLNGTNLVASKTTRGEKTTYTFDYRHRVVKTTVAPRQGTTLESNRRFLGNLLLFTKDAYGRHTYCAYRESDARKVRSIKGTRAVTNPEFASFSEILNKARVSDAATAPNVSFLITDFNRDAEGQVVSTVDPRGISTQTSFDSRGRKQFVTEASGTADETLASVLYDANSNIVELRSPRYFDDSDNDGFGKANTVVNYGRRNLPISRVVAAGANDYQENSATDVRATKTYTYYNDGRLRGVVDARGNESFPLWHQCCGRSQGSIDREGHGFYRNVDYFGNVTHTAIVQRPEQGGLIVGAGSGNNQFTLADAHDPANDQTVNETTYRYDARNRLIAKTVWLEPLGYVDPNAPPIAGGNLPVDPAVVFAANSSQPNGLTTRIFYDDDLADGLGLDGGMTVPRLGGSGNLNLNVTPLLGELAADGVAMGSDSDFRAMAQLNPDNEIAVIVQDGLYRTVASAIFGSDGALITWDTTGFDSVVPVSGFANTVETTSVDALDHVRRSRSDGAGRVIETVDAEGNATRFRFDSNSNLLRSRDPNNVGHDCDFDFRNRRVSCTDTAGDSTSTMFDHNSNAISRIDAKGKIISCNFDPRGRKYHSTDRINSVTEMRYDQNSNLTSITDGEGKKTQYLWNSRDLKFQCQYPDHVDGTNPGDQDYGITKLSYDAARRVLVTTDQLGDTCERNFDLANRLLARNYRTRINSPSGAITDSDSFEYDLASRNIKATSGRYDNVVESVFDEAGRETSETLTAFSRSFPVNYRFDAANRKTGITYPDRSTVQRNYTDRNQLEEVQYNGQVVNTRIYDAGSRLESNSHVNDITATYSYHADDRLAGISTNEVGNYSYDYDANKNKISETIAGVMSGFGFGSGGGNATVYDDEDRLTDWYRTGGGLDQSWNLSLVGNWDSLTENGNLKPRSYSDAHEVTTISGNAVTHDAKGNTTGNAAGHSYEWDFDNRLRTATVPAGASQGVAGTHSYSYDAFGRRVSKIVDATTTLFVCAGQQIVSEYEFASGTAPIVNSPSQKYAYGSYIDEPILKDGKFADGSSGIVYYSHNQQFSITALTGSNGSVFERYGYSPYGSTEILNASGVLVSSSAFNNPYTYTGRRIDSETGMMYFRARYYDSTTGEFIGRDPLGYIDGMSLYRGYFVPGGVDPTGLERNWWNPSDWGPLLCEAVIGNEEERREMMFGNNREDQGRLIDDLTTNEDKISDPNQFMSNTKRPTPFAEESMEQLSETAINHLAGGGLMASGAGGRIAGGARGTAGKAPKNVVKPRITRSGEQAVRITRPDGSVIDISPTRVKEFVPNNHPKAPQGALNKVKFDNALPGTKGFKRPPTPAELEVLRNLGGGAG